MTERRDETNWEEEVAAAEETKHSGSGVGIDEPKPETPVQEEVAAVGGDGGRPAESEGAADPEPSPEEPTPEATVEEPKEPAAAKMAQYDETFVTLEPGQTVEGKVVQVGADEVMVDVGYKTEGRIPLHELGLSAGQKPEDVVAVGDSIDVYVIKVEDTEGNVLLSKRRADNRAAWERLEAVKASGEVIEAVVSERVKGGLLVDVGVRGFIPASHVARNFVENLDKYVGQTLRLKVIELDRQRNNVVLSHKVVLEEEYEKAKEQAFAQLSEGKIVNGTVRRITDFGAFVDVGGGVEGLLHVSEMAWSRVRHPSDVVKEGDEIRVMVLKVDPESERISLSLKETLPDPWETVGERYNIGQIVPGTVTRVVDFGAFVKLEDGIEGLVHISQLADHHVTNPAEVVKPGDEVDVRVVSLDEAKRRIGLSMKQGVESSRPRERRSSRRESDNRSQPTSSGADTSVTLGDVFEGLGSLLESAREEAEQEQEPEA